MKALHIALGFVLLIFTGCHAAQDEPVKYAELRVAKDGRSQVLIQSKQWTGIMTIHGYGGYEVTTYCWVTLTGDGPIYKDPKLIINSGTRFAHRGVIEVDRMAKQVVIKLEQSRVEKTQSAIWEPSIANGTYRIREINDEPFLIRE